MTTTAPPPAPAAPVTLAALAREVYERKAAAGVRSAPGELRRLLGHIPGVRVLTVTELRRATLYLILAEVASLPLSPRTQRHILEGLDTVIGEACAAELLPQHPAPEWRRRWPKLRDSEQFHRAESIFSGLEVAQLCADPRLGADRRALYVLKGMLGLRHEEAARLTWGRLELEVEPLGRATITRTKTGVDRVVPVHPTAAAELRAWRVVWPRWYGRDVAHQREPWPADLVVPTRRGAERAASTSQHDLDRDLARLGLRHRRGHDLRRTFVSLAREAGCNVDLLRAMTHGSHRSMLDVYSTYSWAALCAEVLKLVWPEYDGRQLALPGFPSPAAAVSPARLERATNGLKAPWPTPAHRREDPSTRRRRLQALVLVRQASSALAAEQFSHAATFLEAAISLLNLYQPERDDAGDGGEEDSHGQVSDG